MKTDLSDHFSMFSYIDEEVLFDWKGEETIFERKKNNQSILSFNNILSKCDRESLFLKIIQILPLMNS